MGKADDDGRADLPKDIEKDALASFDVVAEDGSEGFIVDILTSQHLVNRIGVEHPHTITPIRCSDVQGEGRVVLEDIG